MQIGEIEDGLVFSSPPRRKFRFQILVQLFEIFFSTRRASKTLKALPPELIKGLLFGSV